MLAEMRRVLKPGGRYLFPEHVRSDDPKLARKQDRYEGLWKAVCFGCHCNRDTLPRIEAAFEVEDVEHGEPRTGRRRSSGRSSSAARSSPRSLRRGDARRPHPVLPAHHRARLLGGRPDPAVHGVLQPARPVALSQLRHSGRAGRRRPVGAARRCCGRRSGHAIGCPASSTWRASRPGSPARSRRSASRSSCARR